MVIAPHISASALLTGLVTVSVKASVVLIAAAAASRWKGTSAATRHAIWCAAIIGALAIPVGQIMLPSWKLEVLPPVIVQQAPSAQRDAPAMVAHAAAPVPAAPGKSQAAPQHIPSPTASISDDRAQLPSPRSALVALWIAGMIAILAQWTLGIIRRRALHRSAVVPRADWRNAWDSLGVSFRRQVDVRESPVASVPMTWGVVRPVILVPGAAEWSSQERRAALLHEVAHINRFDAAWQCLSRLMLMIFWFNPLAWLANAMLRSESERACDDAVLRGGAKASDYAQQLVDVLAASAPRSLPVAALSMARRSGMAIRLHALLNSREVRGRLSARIRAAVLVVTGAVSVPLAQLSFVAGVIVMPWPERVQSRDTTRVSVRRDTARRSPVRADTATPRYSIAAEDTTHVRGEVDVAPAPLPRVADTTRIGTTADFAAPVRAQVASGCLTREESTSFSWNTHSDGSNESTSVKWVSRNCRLTFDLRGTLKLNANASDVASLTPDGSMMLEIEENGHTRRVRIEEKRGSLTRQFWMDDREAPWNAVASEWLSYAIVALDRRTALAADQRLPLLLANGGTSAALDDIEKSMSDYAARAYYTKLFRLRTLNDAEVQRVVSHVGTWGSDHDRAELLLEASKQPGFGEGSYIAFARSAGSIRSDYDKRRALAALLARRDLPPAVVREMLAGTRGMRSDHDLAELLTAIAGQYAISDATRPYYLEALRSFRSDYDHRRVLQVVLRNTDITPAALTDMLRDAARIGSDYDLAEVLVSAASQRSLGDAAYDAFFEAYATIQSDNDAHRVLTALIKRPGTRSDALARVIEAARTLRSDYDRASLLVEVAESPAFDSSLRPALEQAAKSVRADHDYRRVMNALERKR